jgi:hypothetical protein
LAAGVSVLAAVTAFGGSGYVAVATPPRHLVQQVQLLASADQRQQARSTATRTLRQTFHLPTSLRTLIGARTVQIDPYEADAAWAYGLHLQPVPVFQTYSAYTSWLDRDNARSLTGPHAPDMILRDASLATIDGRFTPFESPAYQLAELCHYRETAAAGSWQLWQRVPQRCGRPTVLGTHRLGSGPTAVPAAAPGEVVAATFSVPTQLSDRLRRLALRQVLPVLSINGVPYRFVVGTAADLHVLSQPRTPGVRRTPGSRYPTVRTLQLPDLAGATVTFYAIPFA